MPKNKLLRYLIFAFPLLYPEHDFGLLCLAQCPLPAGK